MNMIKSAEFSDCGKYRYVLIRHWDEGKPYAMCIGLNPSTGNAENDDPTIRRLITILSNIGFGGLYMTNLFALISAYPEDLRKCCDPVKDNDIWLARVRQNAKEVIYCWGNFKQAEYRAKKIKTMFPVSKCFGKNFNGSPKHPLYLKSQTQLIDF